jgi:hypothetical protein
MWHVDGFDESGFGVVLIPVAGVDPAEFGLAMGLVEGDLYPGGGLPLTDAARTLLSERLGVVFDPGLECFAEELRDYPGEVRFGWYPFAESLLRLRDESVVEVGSSRRIVWKSFALPERAGDDVALLGMLLDHVAYRGLPPVDDRVPLHGPYPLPRIGLDSFEAVGAEDEAEALSGWVDRSAELPPVVRERISDEVLSPVRQADSRYRLTGVDDQGAPTDFHEVVLVDRAVNSLTLLTATSGGRPWC